MVDALMLGADIAAALPELRAQAESLMRDTVLVERANGGVTTDPVTLEETPTYDAVHTGPARVQRPGTQPAETVAGEVEFGVALAYVQMPLSVTGIKRNDRVTVTAIDDLTDPDLLGLVATVQANLTKSHPTKRTLVCEEVS